LPLKLEFLSEEVYRYRPEDALTLMTRLRSALVACSTQSTRHVTAIPGFPRVGDEIFTAQSPAEAVGELLVVVRDANTIVVLDLVDNRSDGTSVLAMVADKAIAKLSASRA
jgi:hypothetical protein